MKRITFYQTALNLKSKNRRKYKMINRLVIAKDYDLPNRFEFEIQE